MENKIEFNWEKYQSGEYDVVTRDGKKIEQLHKFNMDCSYSICGVINGNNYVAEWHKNGNYWDDGDENENDLFLIPKEDHIVEPNETLIPELKGILMEVSHYEDFKTSTNLNVFGINSGNFLTHIGSYQYARPIKEVKECWVNVFEDNGKLIIGQSHFDSKEEAIKFKSNNVKYIKTIRITNEKDGQTN